jgi:hypothetical protein
MGEIGDIGELGGVVVGAGAVGSEVAVGVDGPQAANRNISPNRAKAVFFILASSLVSFLFRFR